MSTPVIKIENISKQFIIAHESKERYTTLRDAMVKKAQKVFSFHKTQPDSNAKASKENFWALKDVSFDVFPGDRVGIIGRNGAGKSTLLKVLSRITEPSSGRITLKGRVASLLEVGTGFHPELTGRENVFLNGAILGMKRSEVRKKFDEIVAFAEVENFLDTPVKRYSSGMYVRLAFAVAANLEPEILIVDEVLAVGDAQFQKKCLGKMEDVSKNEGRTVLFVSHQMDAIETLTSKAVYLKGGVINSLGETKSIVNKYLHDFENAQQLKDYKNRSGNSKAIVTNVEIMKDGKKVQSVKQGESFDVVVRIESEVNLKMDMSFVLENFREHAIFCTQFTDKNAPIDVNGHFEVVIPITLANLRQGDYLFSMALFRPDKTEFYDVVLHFPLVCVEGMDEKNEFPVDNRWGDLYYPIAWSLK